jgi:hypothetical protein
LVEPRRNAPPEFTLAVIALTSGQLNSAERWNFFRGGAEFFKFVVSVAAMDGFGFAFRLGLRTRPETTHTQGFFFFKCVGLVVRDHPESGVSAVWKACYTIFRVLKNQ